MKSEGNTFPKPNVRTFSKLTTKAMASQISNKTSQPEHRETTQMPDPESYSSPGYIDVLYIDEKQQQAPSITRHSHVNVTPGYSKDQYDDERWLSVTDAAIRFKNGEEKWHPPRSSSTDD